MQIGIPLAIRQITIRRKANIRDATVRVILAIARTRNVKESESLEKKKKHSKKIKKSKHKKDRKLSSDSSD
jgi:hypothetical protein